MKKFLASTISLLRKHKRFGGAVISLVGAVICLVLFATLGRHEWIYGALFLLTMTTWEISDVFLLEKQGVTQAELLNLKDKLCLANHEVERLKLELETAQAVLAREQAYHPEPAAGIIPAEAPKPRPKRRPAPKRKPKTEETKDENKD